MHELGIAANGAPISEPEDLISKPFVANGAGIDRLLDNTDITLRSSGAVLTVVAGGATQTTDLAFSTGDGSITANTSTTDGAVTTTATSTSVVPVQSAQTQAIAAINASMAGFSAAVNTRV